MPKPIIGEREKIAPTCDRCGWAKALHYSLNHADPPFISAEVLVCPTAVYQDRAARQRQGKAGKPKSLNRPKRSERWR